MDKVIERLGLSKKDFYQFIYSPDSDIKDVLKEEIAGMKAMDVIIHILKKKRREQEGKIDSKIYCLVAKTGAGKSTYMMYALFKEFIEKRKHASIVCTQNRVILARNNIGFLTAMGMKGGVDVGYITGSEILKPTNSTSITYMTIQILVNKILTQQPKTFGMNYPLIVIDEVHDTGVETAQALHIIKKYLMDNYKESYCPIFILASATIDPPSYVGSFGADPLNPLNVGYIGGTTNFEIDRHYLEIDPETPISSVIDPKIIQEKGLSVIENAKTQICEYIKQVNELPPPEKPDEKDISHILVILKGAADIEKVYNAAKEYMQKEKMTFFEPEESIKFDASINPPPKGRWFSLLTVSSPEIEKGVSGIYILTKRKQLHGESKIVISTPVTESGLTIPDLYAIIDSGYQNKPIPFALYGYSQLSPIAISNQLYLQRVGRVGRNAPGKFQGLYSIEAADAMQPNEFPGPYYSESAAKTINDLLVYDNALLLKGLSTLDVSVHRLLALEKSKPIFPKLDIIKQGFDMFPFSIDLIIMAYRMLKNSGLINRDGQISSAGYQATLIEGVNIGEKICRAYLTKEGIHQIDITIFLRIIQKSNLNYNFLSKLDLSYSIKNLYIEEPKYKTSEKEMIINLLKYAFQIVAFMNNKEPIKGIPKEVNLRNLKDLVIKSINNPKNILIDYIPSYSDNDKYTQNRILSTISKVLDILLQVDEKYFMEKNDTRKYFLRRTIL